MWYLAFVLLQNRWDTFYCMLHVVSRWSIQRLSCILGNVGKASHYSHVALFDIVAHFAFLFHKSFLFLKPAACITLNKWYPCRKFIRSHVASSWATQCFLSRFNMFRGRISVVKLLLVAWSLLASLSNSALMLSVSTRPTTPMKLHRRRHTSFKLKNET